MSVGVKLEGVDELTKKFDRVQVDKIFKDVMTPQAHHIQGVSAKYPKASNANRPNSAGRWYERGFGPKWNTQQGVHGNRTSQTLNRQWKVSVNGVRAEISNAAGYAEYVHGERQSKFHSRRGWKKVVDEIKRNINDIEAALREYTNKLLS